MDDDLSLDEQELMHLALAESLNDNVAISNHIKRKMDFLFGM